MADIPRLNGIIKILESGGTPITAFSSTDLETAVANSTSAYDGIVYEMEHGPYDNRALRDALQYMLNRRQLVHGETLAPAVTPIVRIPPNGGEQNQWIAKQVLDSGAYGVVWPHVSTAEDAYNAVAACRYPRPKDAPSYEPEGVRGDAPGVAARYWGIGQQEYYQRADVWPLAPNGELLVIIMCEEVRAIDELPRMLKEVPGIGVVLIGEGDLSQNLGYPRQYEHPVVADAMRTILRICQEHNVPCGHPHVDPRNVGRLVEEGYRFLMAAPTRSYGGLEASLKATGRAPAS
jgi:4-hydroxy-2-oxoheptanedioate aldolase